MKTTTITMAILLMAAIGSAQSQSYWEPYTNITGYISTEFNWFDNLEGFDYDYGAAVSEAGLLMSYRPTSQLTIRGVFVYRPGYEFDKMLNEAYGEYALTPYLNVRAGRFLQSLSPTNTYYYAPVNTSATLPILVSNNEFFPLNIDGVSVNGQFGNDFRFNYDVFAGGYRNDMSSRTGALGFFGGEVNYFNSLLGADPIDLPDYNNVAIAGTAGVSYKNYVDVGFGVFNPRNEIVTLGFQFEEDELFPGSPAEYMEFTMEFEKIAYGVNARLQYGNTQIKAEYWEAEISTEGFTSDYDAYYVELSQRINTITPYVRYEKQNAGDLSYSRYTGGVNFKPTFATTLKLEYLLYTQDDVDDNLHGFVGSFIYSF
ncbi:hypothetical protein QA596_08915 [Balneolales bacterium ANBcel1]|nr:hypothetical protein [Balneolales bacterium ANBcel1]